MTAPGSPTDDDRNRAIAEALSGLARGENQPMLAYDLVDPSRLPAAVFRLQVPGSSVLARCHHRRMARLVEAYVAASGKSNLGH